MGELYMDALSLLHHRDHKLLHEPHIAAARPVYMHIIIMGTYTYLSPQLLAFC